MRLDDGTTDKGFQGPLGASSGWQEHGRELSRKEQVLPAPLSRGLQGECSPRIPPRCSDPRPLGALPVGRAALPDAFCMAAAGTWRCPYRSVITPPSLVSSWLWHLPKHSAILVTRLLAPRCPERWAVRAPPPRPGRCQGRTGGCWGLSRGEFRSEGLVSDFMQLHFLNSTDSLTCKCMISSTTLGHPPKIHEKNIFFWSKPACQFLVARCSCCSRAAS